MPVDADDVVVVASSWLEQALRPSASATAAINANVFILMYFPPFYAEMAARGYLRDRSITQRKSECATIKHGDHKSITYSASATTPTYALHVMKYTTPLQPNTDSGAIPIFLSDARRPSIIPGQCPKSFLSGLTYDFHWFPIGGIQRVYCPVGFSARMDTRFSGLAFV